MQYHKEYDKLQIKLDYLESKVEDLISGDSRYCHQMSFFLDEMDVVRRQILKIETYEFYKQIGESQS